MINDIEHFLICVFVYTSSLMSYLFMSLLIFKLSCQIIFDCLKKSSLPLKEVGQTEDYRHLGKIPKKYLWNNILRRPGIPELKDLRVLL